MNLKFLLYHFEITLVTLRICIPVISLHMTLQMLLSVNLIIRCPLLSSPRAEISLSSLFSLLSLSLSLLSMMSLWKHQISIKSQSWDIIVVVVILVVVLDFFIIVVIVIIIVIVVNVLDILIKNAGLYQVSELSYGLCNEKFGISAVSPHGIKEGVTGCR